jgi:hypothetical protein
MLGIVLLDDVVSELMGEGEEPGINDLIHTGKE